MRSLLWLALLCHFAFATAFAFTTPSFEAPDESSHYAYAWHLANAGTLPLTPALAQQRGLPQSEAAVLAHHPPLYYALLAATLQLAGARDAVFSELVHERFGDPQAPGGHLHFRHGNGQGDGPLHLLRMVSVLLGAITVWLVHRLGRACCPEQPRVADLAALLAACLPMFAFLQGALNSDVLAITLANATVLVCVRWCTDARRMRGVDGIGLGVLLGLALLTKLTALFLLGIAAIAMLVAWRRERTQGPLRAGLVAFATALLLSGWWFVRNAQLHGDPLALAAHDAAFTPIPPELRWNYLFGIGGWPASVPSFVPTVFTSLLGRFGWFTLPPPPALVWLAAGVLLVALFGLLRTVCERTRCVAVRGFGLLLLVLVLVFVGTAQFNWKAPQPQGRLLLPAIGPAAVLLAAGLLRATTWLPGRRWLAALLPITTALVYTMWFRPAFDPQQAPAPAWHRALVSGITQAATAPTIAWRGEPPAPGAAAPTLRWRDADAPAGTRYTLYAFDAHGRVWLASHEWSKGALTIEGDELALPESLLSLLPRGVELSFVLRRVPTTANEDPRQLSRSAPLPFRRE